MRFKVKFADLFIEIESVRDEIKKICELYLTDEEKTDIKIVSSQEDIEAEREKTTEIYSDVYLETLAILRKLASIIPEKNRFLMHGAAISYKDKGYMFTAVSGTGKSTHISLWKKYLRDTVTVVNGDKPFVAIDEDNVKVYGSPWCGKERWHTNCCVPLEGLCFIAQGKENKIQRMSAKDCLFKLYCQVHIPREKEVADNILKLMGELLQRVPLYYMECDMSEEAVKTSFEAMTGLEYSKYKID